MAIGVELCSGHQRLTPFVVWRQEEMCYFGIKKGIQRLADNDILSCLQQTDVIQL